MKRILLIPPRISTLMHRNQGRVLKITLLVLVLITALYTKEYKGEYQGIINNHIGGILYVLFGSLLFSVLFPHRRIFLLVLLAFSFTSLLEFIQYFRFPVMVELTRNKICAYLFGNSFNWFDFPYYGIGALLGLLVLMLLRHSETAA